jgi:hypothetical protein
VTWGSHSGLEDARTEWERLQDDPWRAGRLVKRPPSAGPDEFSSLIHDWYSLNWLSGFDLPPGIQTAQETMKAFQRDRLAPALRAMGFQGSGSKFQLRESDPVGYVGVSRHRYSNRLVVGFTLVLSVGWPAGEASWCRSLASVLQSAGEDDCEWRLPAGADTDDLLEDVVASLRTYGLPALEEAIKETRTV